MKPDRFYKIVERDAPGWEWRDQQVAIKMLRRQHAAYVRILRTVLRDEMYDTENYRRLSAAILAAFDKYKRGLQ